MGYYVTWAMGTSSNLLSVKGDGYIGDDSRLAMVVGRWNHRGYNGVHRNTTYYIDTAIPIKHRNVENDFTSFYLKNLEKDSPLFTLVVATGVKGDEYIGDEYIGDGYIDIALVTKCSRKTADA